MPTGGPQAGNRRWRKKIPPLPVPRFVSGGAWSACADAGAHRWPAATRPTSGKVEAMPDARRVIVAAFGNVVDEEGAMPFPCRRGDIEHGDASPREGKKFAQIGAIGLVRREIGRLSGKFF